MAVSYSQAEGLWIQAGGPASVAPIAAAIMLAESGGNPAALNPTDNGGRQSSFGLWQISTGTHTPPDPNWQDPLTNAKLAVQKYNGAGGTFSPWGTYVTGAYKRFLQGGVPPDMTAGGGGIPASPSNPQLASASNPLDPSTWFAGIGNILAEFGNYLYIGIVLVGGAALMLIGLLLLMRESGAPGAGLISVTPVGKAARILS